MTNSEAKILLMKSKEGGELGLDDEDGAGGEEIQEVEEPFSEDNDEGKSEY